MEAVLAPAHLHARNGVMTANAPEICRQIAHEDRTAALGRALAALARPGDVILLEGPVGAGKSHLARAFIRARAGDPRAEVPSPTFTLVQTYPDALTGGEVWHADLYRLADPGELVELGLDEAMDRAICLIEWPDRLDMAPGGALRIRLNPLADAPDLRRITLSGDPARWAMAARAAVIAALTDRAGWGAAWLSPLAGDASARRYFRLHRPDGASAVLMDAPPGSLDSTISMTEWLRGNGFRAPDILAADPAEGLLLIEDFGDDLLARRLEAEPALAPEAYARVTDLLAELHRLPPPDFIRPLDGPELAAQVGLFGEWYAPAAPDLGPIIARLHARLCADTPPVCGLRDLHAENIFWSDPLGLIDFQDAVAAHPAYDLVSCLQDARRDVDPAIESACIARYIARTGADAARFRAAYALLGAQRNLRILGIFTRLARRDGKPRYLAMMPRVWGLVSRNLAHPELAELADALAGIPAPEATP